MFMFCIGTLIFCLVEVFAFPSQHLDLGKTTTPVNDRQDPNRPSPSIQNTVNPSPDAIKRPDPGTTPMYGSPSESDSCEGEHCNRPPPNLIAIIVGSLCGAFLIALIVVLIIWFCSRRRQRKQRKALPMTPAVKFIEYPALYTGATSTADSTSRLYGMSATRNDSISSHLYEKINYNERS